MFLFHSSPEEITGDSQVESITVRTGEGRHHVATDLVVRSIGYRSTPIPGLTFDDARGVFSNVDGRLVDETGAIVPGGRSTSRPSRSAQRVGRGGVTV